MHAAHRLTLLSAFVTVAFVTDKGQPEGAASVSETSTPVRDPRHVALLIGVSDYQVLTDNPSAANGGLTDLWGPGNDVKRMRTSLLQWGFTDSSDVRVLTNRAATRDGIGRAFKWLQERASDTSDVVVVFFSGHGTSVADENREEADGKDEAIVPYDAVDFLKPADVVIDDSLGVWLGAIKTHNVTMIVDACYSGSINRGEPPGRAKGLSVKQTGSVRDALLEAGTARLGHTLITASRSFETAQEIEFPRGSNKWNGVLTYHLTRMLDGASATRGLRYDDLMGALRQAVAGEGVSQVPQVDGDSTSQVFRSHVGLASRAFAIVNRQNGSELTIGIGAVHGVRPSAVYDVYAPDETRFAGGHLARVKVEAVEDTISRGRIIGETGEPIPNAARLPAGARAVLSLVPLGGTEVPRLRLFVASSARDDFTKALTRIDTSRVEVVRDSLRAHAVITRGRGILEVVADGVALPPQLPEGQPLPPSVVIDKDTVMGYTDATLCGALSRAFSIAKLAELRNTTAPAELRAYVRVVRAGSPSPFDTTTTADTVTLGTTIAPAKVDVYAYVSVPEAAVAKTRLYVSGAVAGFASDPFVFWPTRQDERFPLNVWKPIWTGVALSPPAGRETIKLTVNSDQYDLRSLVNAAELCRERSASRGIGKGFESNADSVVGWTTVSRTVHILPPKR